jgi:2-polyprenyl-6-methoxyphenol hydroxylase-like FAD-dependent oxidoreductase
VARDRATAGCDELYFDAVSQIKLPRWSQGRTAPVGDASVLLSGEGAAFAMAAAYILANELDRPGGDYARAFAAYESRFRPFIERAQKSARGFASSFAPKQFPSLVKQSAALRAWQATNSWPFKITWARKGG